MLALLAAAPSKTPFVIVGAALGLFAVLVTALGLRSETFPASRGARTGVCALAAVLVATAMATAVLTS